MGSRCAHPVYTDASLGASLLDTGKLHFALPACLEVLCLRELVSKVEGACLRVSMWLQGPGVWPAFRGDLGLIARDVDRAPPASFVATTLSPGSVDGGGGFLGGIWLTPEGVSDCRCQMVRRAQLLFGRSAVRVVDAVVKVLRQIKCPRSAAGSWTEGRHHADGQRPWSGAASLPRVELAAPCPPT